MSNTEAVSDLDLSSIITPYTQQSSNNTILVDISSKGVVQDREESLRNCQHMMHIGSGWLDLGVYYDVERGGSRVRMGDRNGWEGSRKMNV